MTTSVAQAEVYGKENFNGVSRFVKEIPSECINEIRLKTAVWRYEPTSIKEVGTLDGIL